MSGIDDGGPAFPIPNDGQWLDPETCTRWEPFNGMSLRDWMAGMAMPAVYREAVGELSESQIASDAYRMADAMLAARGRKGGA